MVLKNFIQSIGRNSALLLDEHESISYWVVYLEPGIERRNIGMKLVRIMQISITNEGRFAYPGGAQCALSLVT